MPLLRSTLLLLLLACASAVSAAPRKIGVLFAVHGGADVQDVPNTFDSTLQFFQYDPNNVMYRGIIWNPAMWPKVVAGNDSQAYANAATQLKKYTFEYERIGGIDPAPSITDAQLAALTRELRREGRRLKVEFLTDQVQWIGTQEQTDRLPWPRHLYNPQAQVRSGALQRGRPRRAAPQEGRYRAHHRGHDGGRRAFLENLRRGGHDPPHGGRLEPAQWHRGARALGQ
jgi:hypothetical protein